MKTISIEEVVLFQKKILDKTGGAFGIRDLGLVESALNKALLTDILDGHRTGLDYVMSQ